MTSSTPRPGPHHKASRPPPHARPAAPGTAYRYRNQVVHIPDGYFVVGRLIGAHGLHGELRVELHTDFPERFTAGARLYLGVELRQIEVSAARPHKSMILLLVGGIESRMEAESLRGEWLYIRDEDAVPLDSDTFWVHDIVGLRVETVEGLVLGVVSDVLFTGANEVYLVTPQDGINRGREILLPAIADVVQSVDLDDGVIKVRLLPGLVDES